MVPVSRRSLLSLRSFAMTLTGEDCPVLRARNDTGIMGGDTVGIRLFRFENKISTDQAFLNMQTPRDLRNLNISVIIPAYNEGKNILNVLRALREVPAIREIIVVSDGSADDTAERARNFGGVKVIALAQNVGKTEAARRGAVEAQCPALLFCDADLQHLKVQHFSDLIERYCEGYDMVIMDKGSQPWVFKHVFQSVPAVSGTRILEKRHFFAVPFKAKDRFQFENRINDYYLEHGLRIAVSPAQEVHDTRKFIKYPFWKGLLLDIKGGWQVLASDGLPSIPRNLATFRRIRRLTRPPKSS